VWKPPVQAFEGAGVVHKHYKNLLAQLAPNYTGDNES
jgi:hypothetical protein